MKNRTQKHRTWCREYTKCYKLTQVFVSVCVSPVRALTFDSIDLETSFLACSYIFRISKSWSNTKVIWSRSRSWDRKKFKEVQLNKLAGDLLSIEKQSYYQLLTLIRKMPAVIHGALSAIR